jgi:hypothetical protein
MPLEEHKIATNVRSSARKSPNGSSHEDEYSKDVELYSYDLPRGDQGQPSQLDNFLSGSWIHNPRLRNCFANVQIGMKTGGIVGGIFGGLAGSVYAFKERRPVILPASILVSAGSFAFFLGCGMLIRC